MSMGMLSWTHKLVCICNNELSFANGETADSRCDAFGVALSRQVIYLLDPFQKQGIGARRSRHFACSKSMIVADEQTMRNASSSVDYRPLREGGDLARHPVT